LRESGSASWLRVFDKPNDQPLASVSAVNSRTSSIVLGRFTNGRVRGRERGRGGEREGERERERERERECVCVCVCERERERERREGEREKERERETVCGNNAHGGFTRDNKPTQNTHILEDGAGDPVPFCRRRRPITTVFTTVFTTVLFPPDPVQFCRRRRPITTVSSAGSLHTHTRTQHAHTHARTHARTHTHTHTHTVSSKT